MNPDIPRPTPAELNVLEVLWQRGPLSVRAISEAVYDAPTPVQYRTVQVHLDRLEKKGLVRRDREQRPLLFAPTVDRDGVIGKELQNLADKVCEGSLAPLILNLAQRATLTAAEKQRLWKLLEGE